MVRVAMAATLPAYAVLQIVALATYRGGWRWFAAVPLLALVPAVTISVAGYRSGSAAWILPMIYACPVAFLFLIGLGIAHRLKPAAPPPNGRE
jgi:hypothetical protein